MDEWVFVLLIQGRFVSFPIDMAHIWPIGFLRARKGPCHGGSWCRGRGFESLLLRQVTKARESGLFCGLATGLAFNLLVLESSPQVIFRHGQIPTVAVFCGIDAECLRFTAGAFCARACFELCRTDAASRW